MATRLCPVSTRRGRFPDFRSHLAHAAGRPCLSSKSSYPQWTPGDLHQHCPLTSIVAFFPDAPGEEPRIRDIPLSADRFPHERGVPNVRAVARSHSIGQERSIVRFDDGSWASQTFGKIWRRLPSHYGRSRHAINRFHCLSTLPMMRSVRLAWIQAVAETSGIARQRPGDA
jgi:hypothetical protein